MIGANRPRLYATMLAVQSLGAVPIALFTMAFFLETLLGDLMAGMLYLSIARPPCRPCANVYLPTHRNVRRTSMRNLLRMEGQITSDIIFVRYVLYSS